jgi:hypothetical protein
MKLVQFTDNHGREHWINADQVCSIVAYAPDTTQVNFGTEESVVFVKEKVGVVAQKLWSGGRVS